MREGALAALDAVEKATGEREVNVIGYCLGGTLLGATLGYLAAKSDDARQERHVLRQPARLLASRASSACSSTRSRSPSLEKKMNERGYLEGSEMAEHLQPAARQRPGLVVRGQQLPARQGPVPVRPAVLERGLDAHAGEDAQLLPAQHVHQEPAGRARRHRARRRADRPAQGEGAGLLHLHRRGPHRALEDAPTRARSTSAARCASCSAAPATSPASSTRRRRRSTSYWTNDALPATADEWFASATPARPGSWWDDWQRWIERANGGDKVPARIPGATRSRTRPAATRCFAFAK